MIETYITPRVSETDGAGHINNTVMPVWFEAGRNEIFKILTPNLNFDDWRVALVNMNLDYVAQTYYQRDVVIKTWIKKVGTKSFVVYEELHQDDKVCVRGTATYVYFNYKTQQAEPIPESVRQQLNEHIR